MEVYCTGCGCLVDHDVRIVPCNSAACCCMGLPIQLRTVDEVADQLRSAFGTKDLAALGRLLASDARWGDDNHPNRCRSRSDVVATFERLLDEGVDGEVAETIIGPNGVALLLHVGWPDSYEGRGVDFYQAYLVREGVITEIQHHDDRSSAVAALSV
jgi:hypothetical protein